MKYCKKCVMPDTRPGIRIDADGICSGCHAYENRNNTDYDKRFKELSQLCDEFRGGGGYNCAIAVSGGKDSHFQVYVMKEVMHMNPVLFSVEDNFRMTEAGKHNIKNISEEFGCHIISLKPDLKAQKAAMRYTFEKYGKPTWFIDRLIYTFPPKMAAMFRTPLLVYGENVSYEYGGHDNTETYSARAQLNNGVASDIPDGELLAAGVEKSALQLLSAPTAEELAQLNPIYLSYFLPWNSVSNYLFAKSRGFHDLTHEWDRSHHIENFDQVESRAYLVHSWMKYPKFGHQVAADYASRYIRYGLMTREEAVKAVWLHDASLDPLCVRDFCEFLGYRESEFWKIVDSFYNTDIFTKNDLGEWVLKTPLENI